MSYSNNIVRNYFRIIPCYMVSHLVRLRFYDRTITKIIWAIAKIIRAIEVKAIIFVHRLSVSECSTRFSESLTRFAVFLYVKTKVKFSTLSQVAFLISLSRYSSARLPILAFIYFSFSLSIFVPPGSECITAKLTDIDILTLTSQLKYCIIKQIV